MSQATDSNEPARFLSGGELEAKPPCLVEMSISGLGFADNKSSGSLTKSASDSSTRQTKSPCFPSTITRAHLGAWRMRTCPVRKVNSVTKRNKRSLEDGLYLQDFTLSIVQRTVAWRKKKSVETYEEAARPFAVHDTCKRLAETDVVGLAGEIWPCQEELCPWHHDFLPRTFCDLLV